MEKNKSFQVFELTLVKEKNVPYEFNEKADSPRNVYEIFTGLGMQNKAEEEFWILCLDTKNNPIGTHLISRGNLNSSIVHPREVFKRAILNNSSAIILIHNHPSGEPEPSHEDISVTNRLDECGKILGIKIIDHIIIGNNYYSFREENLL